MSEALPKGTERTFTALVEGKAETFDHNGEPGTTLELGGSAFGSQYPIKVFVPAEAAAAIALGGTYAFVLVSENLKRGKTGEKPYDYYWGYRSIATGAAAQPQSEGTPPLVNAAVAMGGQVVPQPQAQRPDATRTSIERQTAAKAATDMYVAQLTNGLAPDWDTNYAQVLDRIENGPVEAQEALIPDSAEVPDATG